MIVLVLAEGSQLMGLSLILLFYGFIFGAMIWGFKLAGRKVENVFLQLLLGAFIGFGIMVGALFVLFGVLFAGCLITGAPSFH